VTVPPAGSGARANESTLLLSETKPNTTQAIPPRISRMGTRYQMRPGRTRVRPVPVPAMMGGWPGYWPPNCGMPP